ncbi:hypothetical protein F385_1759 [Pantoea agglomerans 299R]|nr:hypothetical protein F385_1759 [Pantoea agglomerans 299R]
MFSVFKRCSISQILMNLVAREDEFAKVITVLTNTLRLH